MPNITDDVGEMGSTGAVQIFHRTKKTNPPNSETNQNDSSAKNQEEYDSAKVRTYWITSENWTLLLLYISLMGLMLRYSWTILET